MSDRALPSEDASVEAGRGEEPPTTQTSAEVAAGHSVGPGGPGGGTAAGAEDTAAGQEGWATPPQEADAARCSGVAKPLMMWNVIITFQIM